MFQKSKLRLLYVYAHRTSRYQEVNALLSAGLEVIPIKSLCWHQCGNNGIVYDTDYDNSSDPLYPNWEKYCTLPTNISHTLRATSLLDDEISPDFKRLINKYIDAIYWLANPVDEVVKIKKWFKGKMLLRLFGYNDNHHSLTKQILDAGHKVSDIFDEKTYYLPSATPLVLEDKKILKRMMMFHINVDPIRLNYQWLGDSSLKRVSMCIPYTNESDYLREIKKEFISKIKHQTVLLGKGSDKNDKSNLENVDVPGYISTNKFYQIISNSRCFIETGINNPFHTRFTAIEASLIGLPVLMLDSCGIAHAIKDYLQLNAVSEIKVFRGIFNSIDDINKFLNLNIDNTQLLSEIARTQYSILSKIYSKERSASDAIKIANVIAGDRNYSKKYAVKINKYENISLNRDFPSNIGEKIYFPYYKSNIIKSSNNVLKDEYLTFKKDNDNFNLTIANYIYEKGTYKIDIQYKIINDKNYQDDKYLLEIGKWNKGKYLISLQRYFKNHDPISIEYTFDENLHEMRFACKPSINLQIFGFFIKKVF
tara:strand:+ start:112 stop:1722 length:1611 start_codon:yes stop_codon:yes gene_type:complete